MKEYVAAGKIVNTHGVAGEVKMELWLDSPRFFRRFGRVFIGGRELKILTSREHKGHLILKIEGYDDINASMALKGRTVEVLRADAGLKDGEYFIQDIIGFSVVDETLGEIGTLAEVEETPASLLYVVRGESEHLIPAVEEFVLSVDLGRGEIRVRLIEGM